MSEQRHTEQRKARAMGLRRLRRRRRQLNYEIRSLARGDIDGELLQVFRANQNNVNGNEQGEQDK